ncbi:MAG: hypothetical protein R2715_15995 [Ilumatobacteraceae bacterium]
MHAALQPGHRDQQVVVGRPGREQGQGDVAGQKGQHLSALFVETEVSRRRAESDPFEVIEKGPDRSEKGRTGRRTVSPTRTTSPSLPIPPGNWISSIARTYRCARGSWVSGFRDDRRLDQAVGRSGPIAWRGHGCAARNVFGARVRGGDYLGGRASRSSSSFAVVLTAGLAGSAVVGTFLAVGSTPLPSGRDVVLGLGTALASAAGLVAFYRALSRWRDDRRRAGHRSGGIGRAGVRGRGRKGAPQHLGAGRRARRRDRHRPRVRGGRCGGGATDGWHLRPRRRGQAGLRRDVHRVRRSVERGRDVDRGHRPMGEPAHVGRRCSRRSPIAASVADGPARRPCGRGARHGGNLLYYAATNRGLLSIVAVVTSLYPASTVVLAAVCDRERISPAQTLGLGAAAAALVLVALG